MASKSEEVGKSYISGMIRENRRRVRFSQWRVAPVAFSDA
jgi:hypothetical protein